MITENHTVKTDDGTFISEDVSQNVVFNGQAYVPKDPASIKQFNKMIDEAVKSNDHIEMGNGMVFKPSDPVGQEEIFKAELMLKHGATETQAAKAWQSLHEQPRQGFWSKLWKTSPKPQAPENTASQTSTPTTPPQNTMPMQAPSEPVKAKTTETTKTQTKSSEPVKKASEPTKAKMSEPKKVQNKAPESKKPVDKAVKPKKTSQEGVDRVKQTKPTGKPATA